MALFSLICSSQGYCLEMKVLQVVGARPQFIKSAMLSHELRRNQGIVEVIVHTGQHYDHNMSKVFFQEMEIPNPDYNLEVNNLGHGAMTGKMLDRIEVVLLKEKPDWVIVHGDTNSTLAGALAASKLHLKVAHVEAGLRSFNKRMPEEINRILTDHVSDLLLTPSRAATKNLKGEGIYGSKVRETGDIMYDSCLFYSAKAEMSSRVVSGLGLDRYVLGTIHRAENTDNVKRLTGILDALNNIAQKTRVVVPLHPRTRRIIEGENLAIQFEILDPVSYLDMINLTKKASLIITDSGGLQKEAYFFNKYCLTLRDETEWVELVENGASFLVGANKERILEAFEQVSTMDPGIIQTGLYGTGNTAKLITDSLMEPNDLQ